MLGKKLRVSQSENGGALRSLRRSVALLFAPSFKIRFLVLLILLSLAFELSWCKSGSRSSILSPDWTIVENGVKKCHFLFVLWNSSRQLTRVEKINKSDKSNRSYFRFFGGIFLSF